MISSPYNGLEAFGRHIVTPKSFWLSLACPSNVNYRKSFLKKDKQELRAEMLPPTPTPTSPHGYLELLKEWANKWRAYSQDLDTPKVCIFILLGFPDLIPLGSFLWLVDFLEKHYSWSCNIPHCFASTPLSLFSPPFLKVIFYRNS